jgi:hypothetical protein
MKCSEPNEALLKTKPHLESVLKALERQREEKAKKIWARGRRGRDGP